MRDGIVFPKLCFRKTACRIDLILNVAGAAGGDVVKYPSGLDDGVRHD